MPGPASPFFMQAYRAMYRRFGPQHWWPARTRFEVMVGAILTQNTNWRNVEKAILALRREKALTPLKMRKMGTVRLSGLIRPAGYYRVKAQRLGAFLDYFCGRYKGSASLMARQDAGVLRRELLEVNGIGEETADSILLYALDKPVFVVDAYTRRVLSRHSVITEDKRYPQIQNLFAQNIEKEVQLYKEYHALLVQVCKAFCRPRTPLCGQCPLGRLLHRDHHGI